MVAPKPAPKGNNNNNQANTPSPANPAGVPGSHGGANRPAFGSAAWRAMYDSKGKK